MRCAGKTFSVADREAKNSSHRNQTARVTRGVEIESSIENPFVFQKVAVADVEQVAWLTKAVVTIVESKLI